MPLLFLDVASIAVKTFKWPDPSRTNYFTSRLAYVGQILVARKINEGFSVQITPSFVHRNLVLTELDPNDVFGLRAGGGVKLTNRISLNGEYISYITNPKTYMSQQIYDPLSIGFDIETGGHVFQLFFTNSLGMTEKQFIGGTTDSGKKGRYSFRVQYFKGLHIEETPETATD